jgi:hypothetical protein
VIGDLILYFLITVAIVAGTAGVALFAYGVVTARRKREIDAKDRTET